MEVMTLIRKFFHKIKEVVYQNPHIMKLLLFNQTIPDSVYHAYMVINTQLTRDKHKGSKQTNVVTS